MNKALIICPLSVAIGTKYKQERPEWLKKAHLEAVLTLPPDLFAGQETGSHTCLMVWKTSVISIKETYLMNCKNDGFVVLKGKRFDKDNKWKLVKKGWLAMCWTKYLKQPTIAVQKKLTAQDCWLADAWVETDYSPIFNDPIFLKKKIEKTIRDYLAFRISMFSDINWNKE